MSLGLFVISPSKAHISPTPFTRFRAEDEADSFVVPRMAQDEVFDLIDDFYGASPPRPTTPGPDFGDAEFVDMMENLEEIEKSALNPDSDLEMHDVSPSLHAASALDIESSAVSPALAPTSEREPSGDNDDHMSYDASPSPTVQMAHLVDVDASAPSTSPKTRQRHHSPSLPVWPTNDASHLRQSPDASPSQSSAMPPQITLETKTPQHQHPHTPVLPFTGNMKGPVRGSSVGFSTGGHRSSMQGEMREEEQELTNGDLGDLPPFTGFQKVCNGSSGDKVDSLLAEGHSKAARDLSSSRDIVAKQVTAAVKPVLVKHEAVSQPPIDVAAMGREDSQLGSAATKNLKRSRHDSSPFNAPAKKARHHSPILSSEPSQIPPKQDANGTKATLVEESDSSLTDISLSAILAETPEQLGQQIEPPAVFPPQSDKRERKDSVAMSLRDFKAEITSSPVNEEAVAKHTTATPKVSPKRKRSRPAASANSGPTASKTSGKNKKPAPGFDLKGITEAGILGDVLKSKGPRQTRGQQKAIADIRPDPAQAAKRRHTDHINYKE
ncbi:uncharacterized protein RCC_08262 [Ramularia collo-cygni]|uniref:Uncharacterized protein n=1 Tax=Ramularia collo-cygni TaxID=112498 RepID=A0A2D3UX28_9PEZI|nr:uncharacterized protein RCC_08262 [Ramularia collo-cygni]CZT22392.1 uncharacterized protein RCC_08262 [Ramularia collo-cygni]